MGLVIFWVIELVISFVVGSKPKAYIVAPGVVCIGEVIRNPNGVERKMMVITALWFGEVFPSGESKTMVSKSDCWCCTHLSWSYNLSKLVSQAYLKPKSYVL